MAIAEWKQFYRDLFLKSAGQEYLDSLTTMEMMLFEEQIDEEAERAMMM